MRSQRPAKSGRSRFNRPALTRQLTSRWLRVCGCVALLCAFDPPTHLSSIEQKRENVP